MDNKNSIKLEQSGELLKSWINFTGTKITAPFINRLLCSADEGVSSDQAALFQTILEKEPVIAAHIQTRISAVMACDFSIESEDRGLALKLEVILRKAGIQSLMRHLLDAIVTGYSGSATIWGEGGAFIRKFQHIHPSNWIFDDNGDVLLFTRNGLSVPLKSYPENQFIFHTHLLKPGLPSKGGLLRTLVWLYFFKHYAMRDRARYIEKFGVPFMMAKIRRDEFEDKALRENILSSLARAGSDGAGVITSDSSLEIINASSSGPDTQEWLDYIDSVYALVILGQTASSSGASGFSKGQIQENVRQDILESDCRSLMETLDNQLLAPLEFYLTGSKGKCRIKLDFQVSEDLREKAEIVKILAESGYKADRNWVAKTFSVPLEDENNNSDGDNE